MTSLSVRMREAADTLVEASIRYRGYTHVSREEVAELQDWRPANLRSVADDFQREDSEIEAVRRDLMRLIDQLPAYSNSSYDIAGHIMDQFSVKRTGRD